MRRVAASLFKLAETLVAAEDGALAKAVMNALSQRSTPALRLSGGVLPHAVQPMLKAFCLSEFRLADNRGGGWWGGWGSGRVVGWGGFNASIRPVSSPKAFD